MPLLICPQFSRRSGQGSYEVVRAFRRRCCPCTLADADGPRLQTMFRRQYQRLPAGHESVLFFVFAFKSLMVITLTVDSEYGREWIMYDVGGARTLVRPLSHKCMVPLTYALQRAAWLPYFDNVNAIIFLAPISCFDERLAEDTRINRLEDSFILWTSICSSKLLTKTTMIVFLNKCDLLKRKLKRGVQVKDYLPSYGDRPNDTSSVVKCESLSD